MNKESSAKSFGKILNKLLTEVCLDNAWYEPARERNKSRLEKLIENLTVISCSGLDDRFYYQCLCKIDLFKLPDFYPSLKDINKSLKKRYFILNAKELFQTHLDGITSWDIDAEAWLVQYMIEQNS